MKSSNKIKNQKEIIKMVQDLKGQGKRVVTYNGSFDVLHFGHIESLKEAKKQGDVLIIALNSDRSVRLYKGPTRPINSQKERAEFLAALECVDYITIFDEVNCKDILDKIKPHIHCNGSDWGKNCVEREIVEKNGGKIHILKWQQGFSSSKVIEGMKGCCSKPEIKAVFVDRDGTINVTHPGYVRRASDFKFVPGAISALSKLSKTDYRIIVITNQSGIGRGRLTEKDLKDIHKLMVRELAKKGARIDGIYYCPHLPEDNCLCRKPNIGMFLRAGEDFGINLSKSWMIGNDVKDIVAGRNTNIKTIKIGATMPKELKLEPNYYAEDLSGAVKIVLS